MNGRERFCSILEKHHADRIGFWLGEPTRETVNNYLKEAKAVNRNDLSVIMNDDLRWIAPDFTCWSAERPMFDVLGGKKRESLSQPGIFADCEDVSEVERYTDWPDPIHLDLNKLEALMDSVHKEGMAVASGMWSCFFHVVADFFGMENYFVKMYTDPDVVEAVTERVVDFYIAANERIYQQLAGKIDTFFMGNDLGTQRGLIINPEMYRRFVLPGQKRLIMQAKKYGLHVMVHSCGSIYDIIPDLIDAGIEALHPLQPLATGMNAENLSQFKKDIAFVGGVDTQQLLVHGTAEEVKREVDRLYRSFGDGWIASPSHEGYLSNIPLSNVQAIRDAAMQHKNSMDNGRQ